MVEKLDTNADDTQLDRIDRNIVALCQSVDDMRKDYSKIVYALIGIIAATLGMKLIGTPWYIDVAIYFTEFSTVFLILSLIAFWKEITVSMRATRIVAILLFATSAIAQTFIYQPGLEAAPIWFPPIINVLLSSLAIAFIWASWAMAPKKHARIKIPCKGDNNGKR